MSIIQKRHTGKTLRKVGAITALALSLAACGKDADKVSDGEVEETGVDIDKNPFGALQQLAQTGKEMQEKAKQMEKRKPIEPVKFDALVPLLPAPSGWEKSGDVRAETTQMAQFHISTATQNYKKTGTETRQTMKVSIVDGSYVPMVYAPFLMTSKFSREGTDGHSKGLTIDGHPAFEEWKKKSNSVTLTILVKDRFLITLEGYGVDKNESRNWAKFIPLGKLEKWANDGVTGDQVSPAQEAEKAPEAASTEPTVAAAAAGPSVAAESGNEKSGDTPAK